jgi:hypothetical protein
MTKNVAINCDKCNNDLRYTVYSSEFRIVLSSENKWHAGGACYSMDVPDPFPREKHFCNEKCLIEWIKTTYASLI